jgi:hypothetical protein
MFSRKACPKAGHAKISFIEFIGSVRYFRHPLLESGIQAIWLSGLTLKQHTKFVTTKSADQPALWNCGFERISKYF